MPDVVAAPPHAQDLVGRTVGRRGQGLAIPRVEVGRAFGERGQLRPVHVVVEVGHAAAAFVRDRDPAGPPEGHRPVAVARAARRVVAHHQRADGSLEAVAHREEVAERRVDAGCCGAVVVDAQARRRGGPPYSFAATVSQMCSTPGALRSPSTTVSPGMGAGCRRSTRGSGCSKKTGGPRRPWARGGGRGGGSPRARLLFGRGSGHEVVGEVDRDVAVIGERRHGQEARAPRGRAATRRGARVIGAILQGGTRDYSARSATVGSMREARRAGR